MNPEKSISVFPPPPRIGKGETFPSGWFGDLWNWIASSRPIPDNSTIFGTPTARGIVLSAKQGGGGTGGGSGSAEYNGYFKVISSGTGKVKVVNGADLTSAVCGYVTFFASGVKQRIAVARTEFTITEDDTSVYLEVDLQAKTCLLKQNSPSLPATTPANKALFLLADVSVDDDAQSIIQRWTNGEIFINIPYTTYSGAFAIVDTSSGDTKQVTICMNGNPAADKAGDIYNGTTNLCPVATFAVTATATSFYAYLKYDDSYSCGIVPASGLENNNPQYVSTLIGSAVLSDSNVVISQALISNSGWTVTGRVL